MTYSSTAATIAAQSHMPQLAASVFDIGRGGATALVATSASSILFDSLQNDQQENPVDSPVSSLKRGGAIHGITPEATSVINMAIAMSLHYLSYSIARPSTIALFTSAKTGFAGNKAAFPLAMAFISPTSLMLLFLYGKILGKAGPKGAIRQTTFLCTSVLWISGLLISTLSKIDPISISLFGIGKIPLMQTLVGALFIFRESYVQLLTSQYWSFMASTLNPEQSAKWFSPISGLTSITSAISGFGVKSIVEYVGLPGALGIAGCILTSSLIFTERAYRISDAHGFTPTDKHKEIPSGKKSGSEEEESLIRKASKLFGRVPVLKALFMEILAGQGLATLLNVCFVTKLSETLPDDSERAGWMGKFFASINVVACCLQFGIIPKIMPFLEPQLLWRFMPSAMIVAISCLCLTSAPSLYIISGCFMLFKVLEFSFRRMLDEMVYVPLDFDSRFLGKEIISVFGYRFGKSGMSLALSGATALFGNFEIKELTYLTWGSTLLWLKAAWNVSNLVLTKDQAKEKYEKNLKK